MSLRIVFVDLLNGFGGHTRDALTLAVELRRRGHQIEFVVDGRRDDRLIRSHSFPVHPVRCDVLGRFVTLPLIVANLASGAHVDVLHAFSTRGLAFVAQAARDGDIPLVWTECGRAAPRDMLTAPTVAAISEELKAWLEAHRPGIGGARGVAVIPARIDLSAFTDVDGIRERHTGQLERWGLRDDTFVVMRIARISPDYFRSLIETAEAVGSLAAGGLNVSFVHIGFAVKGFKTLEKRLSATIERINRAVGRTVVVSDQHQLLDAARLVPLADVVAGTGRSAFEAMACRVATFVTGANGFAGVVTPDTVDEIAYFNFSGRNQRVALSTTSSVEKIATTIEALAGDESERRALGEFGYAYAVRRLDVVHGADAYEALYRQARSAGYVPEEEIESNTRPTNSRRIRSAITERLVDHGFGSLLQRARRLI